MIKNLSKYSIYLNIIASEKVLHTVYAQSSKLHINLHHL